MLRKDGRFYDPHFDFDHDGRLNLSELSIYNEIVFGLDDDDKEEDDDDDDF